MADTTLMDKLVSLAKRRGFVFQSSEIYGGLGSVWDYGPLGVELKKNVKDRWWKAMVHARDDIEGIDAAILMHPRVWEASGHVAGFTDPLVDCRQCKNRFRADDKRIKGTPGQPDAQCPVCGSDDACGAYQDGHWDCPGIEHPGYRVLWSAGQVGVQPRHGEAFIAKAGHIGRLGIQRKAQDREATILENCVHAMQERHFGHTWPAVNSPEVNQIDLPQKAASAGTG